jgi:transcriptional regulator with XRE-family HTH domain
MYFSQNIKLLRSRKKRTQDVVAQAMGFSRSTLNSYENALILNPTIESLIAFSDYFKVAIDTLVRVDLGKLSERKLTELELGYDDFVKGTKLRVLATTVDKNNIDNIEMVSTKAKAGYTSGYNDPEYIRTLPTFQLPFLSSERKYRTFQISGDSMLPIPDKAYVTAEYVENWNDIKDGNAYVVLTKDDGIVFKVLYNAVRTRKKLLLKSLNTIYDPYEINITEVKEVWRFINFISNQMPEPATDQNINQQVSKLHQEVKKISEALMGKNKRALN